MHKVEIITRWNWKCQVKVSFDSDPWLLCGLNSHITFRNLNAVKINITMVAMLSVCILCISDTVDEDDDIYDFVEDEENKGDEIYEDLMRTDEHLETVSFDLTKIIRDR